MPISLTGPTAAVTTDTLTSATYTFTADMASDNRSKVFVVTTLGGTQTGVSAHTVDAPKMLIVKKPAVYQQPSAYNTVSGRYGKVPKNVTRVLFRGSAKVAANQWELMPISMDIGVPAGATSYDRANVDASFSAFVAGVWDQKEEIMKALYDGLY